MLDAAGGYVQCTASGYTNGSKHMTRKLCFEKYKTLHGGFEVKYNGRW